ncbi:MAG: MAPEG family protein [Myxococcales bacterium]|nr:MAPEG family protein [Myxococcales bacterium]
MNITPELRWLAATTLLTGGLWIPYVLDRMREHGVWAAMSNPERDQQPEAQWAYRLMSAHANAVENLVVFATLVLVTQAEGVSGTLTTVAAAVYFFARLTHAVVYTLGVPVARTLAFMTGVGAQVTFGLVALGVIG